MRHDRGEGSTNGARPWAVHFFQRHRDDDPGQTVPAREYLLTCPAAVRAKLVAAVKAVADAPPPTFSGGGKWEAMHDDMAGFFEVRADGPKRRHYRLFCLLERDGARCGLGGPSLILIAGMDKRFKTTFTKADYASVRTLGNEYLARNPRSVAK
jgi:hypothetical protein